ncbi:hypothetical protein TWF718_000427 [Orbilia javanica]|uniref:Uncharacterized protein n=1 Tax=Orbilia javanica TaxID=47235 RepID=A0AAN8RM56_9PEZI
MADPGDPDLSLRLLEPKQAIPLVRDEKYLKVATEVTEDIPDLKFKQTPGLLSGTYDLVIGDEYLAVDDSGRVTFQTKSSGPNYITESGVTFITSIFSYTCDGVLKIGLPGVVEYGFGFIDGYLYAKPIVKDLNNPFRIRRRQIQSVVTDKTRAIILRLSRVLNLDLLPIIAAPKYTTASQLGRNPRCPTRPPGLEAVLKPDAPPSFVNGCGDTSFLGSLVPNLVFEPCCNKHDLCFDDCTQSFDGCNESMFSCTRLQCLLKYPEDGSNANSVLLWGCYEAADIYYSFIKSFLGADVFNELTSKRCVCRLSVTIPVR